MTFWFPARGQSAACVPPLEYVVYSTDVALLLWVSQEVTVAELSMVPANCHNSSKCGVLVSGARGKLRCISFFGGIHFLAGYRART